MACVPCLRYAWAIFDYISPVPRDEDDNFYNPEDRGKGRALDFYQVGDQSTQRRGCSMVFPFKRCADSSLELTLTNLNHENCNSTKHLKILEAS